MSRMAMSCIDMKNMHRAIVAVVLFATLALMSYVRAGENCRKQPSFESRSLCLVVKE